ncbi:Pentatricopeptide repeat-containing protein [Nymphaea thermarum]|nr:Pentatricopeptide repeat-containing protein [Nymphaea thermarum]
MAARPEEPGGEGEGGDFVSSAAFATTERTPLILIAEVVFTCCYCKFNPLCEGSLIDMHCKCNYINDARMLFDKIGRLDTVSWTAMISGYVQVGHENGMRLSEVQPTRSTYGSVLSVCAHFTDLVLGQQIHSKVIKLGPDENVYVGSALIIVYSRCSVVEDAHEVSVTVDNRNIVVWNAVLGCYARNRDPSKVVQPFASLLSSSFQPDEVTYTQCFVHVYPSLTWLGSRTMMWQGISPNEVSFACALRMFANSNALEAGKQIHASAIKSGFELNLYVGSALVDMYAECASVEEAHNILAQMPGFECSVKKCTDCRLCAE